MKTTVSLTLDVEAKKALQKQAKANGLSLSGYVNMLGKVYHNILPKKEEKK